MFSDINCLLKSYPRERPPFSKAHEACFVAEYQRNRAGRKGLNAAVARLESWMHTTISHQASPGRILELGAGNLNHVPYEPKAPVYDVIEPFHDLWKTSPYRNEVSSFFDDIGDVPAGRRYDRVISVAVLEHLTDLPGIVAQAALLLDSNGRFQAGIPTEGGLLWGLAWRSTTGIAYRLRTKLDYASVIRHEHINNSDEITAVLQHFFHRVALRRFPINIKHFSFYTVIDALDPKIEFCRAQAEKSKSAVA